MDEAKWKLPKGDDWAELRKAIGEDEEPDPNFHVVSLPLEGGDPPEAAKALLDHLTKAAEEGVKAKIARWQKVVEDLRPDVQQDVLHNAFLAAEKVPALARSITKGDLIEAKGWNIYCLPGGIEKVDNEQLLPVSHSPDEWKLLFAVPSNGDLRVEVFHRITEDNRSAWRVISGTPEGGIQDEVFYGWAHVFETMFKEPKRMTIPESAGRVTFQRRLCTRAESAAMGELFAWGDEYRRQRVEALRRLLAAKELWPNVSPIERLDAAVEAIKEGSPYADRFERAGVLGWRTDEIAEDFTFLARVRLPDGSRHDLWLGPEEEDPWDTHLLFVAEAGGSRSVRAREAASDQHNPETLEWAALQLAVAADLLDVELELEDLSGQQG